VHSSETGFRNILHATIFLHCPGGMWILFRFPCLTQRTFSLGRRRLFICADIRAVGSAWAAFMKSCRVLLSFENGIMTQTNYVGNHHVRNSLGVSSPSYESDDEWRLSGWAAFCGFCSRTF
jgi:hypothetical protein